MTAARWGHGSLRGGGQEVAPGALGGCLPSCALLRCAQWGWAPWACPAGAEHTAAAEAPCCQPPQWEASWVFQSPGKKENKNTSQFAALFTFFFLHGLLMLEKGVRKIRV